MSAPAEIPRCANCSMPATCGVLMPDPNGSLCAACYERKATKWMGDLVVRYFLPPTTEDK